MVEGLFHQVRIQLEEDEKNTNFTTKEISPTSSSKKPLIIFFKVEKQKAIIVSGYFNPIRKGHLEYFNNAKAIADQLFVIVNNDHQRALKGSKEFQDENERMIIVSNIKAVDKAILSIDTDRTVCATIKMIADKFELGFANGRDQNNDTIPEKPICEQMNVFLIDGAYR